MRALLKRIRAAALVLPGEGRLTLLAAGSAFLGMASFYLLRPLRDATGIARGADKLPWLMTGTLLAMLAFNPLYAWSSARWPRRIFVPWAYRAFGLMMLLLGMAFALGPKRGWLGPIFFIWLSVFNLFVVAVLWSVLTDLFSEDQGRRLFGWVAMGGTLGAVGGALGTEFLLRMALPLWLLFPLGALALEGATTCLSRLGRHSEWRGAGTGLEPGPRPLEGMRLVLRDPYIFSLAAFMFLFTTASTVLYVVQGEVVGAAVQGLEARTRIFARLDLGTNVLTLLFQGVLTGRMLQAWGAPRVLLLLPMACAAGFLGLSLAPSLGLLAAVVILERALHYGVDRPVRGVLFIPLDAEAKYKSRAFIDTFMYRAGDVVGVWLKPLLALGGLPAAPVAGLIALIWVGCGIQVGRLRTRMGR